MVTKYNAFQKKKKKKKAVGALNWAALATCPDITFAVGTVVRFTANPEIAHCVMY